MFDGHTYRFFIIVFSNVSSTCVSPTKTSYVDNSTSFSAPTPLVALPWGSASIKSTFLPFLAKIVLILIVVVVFPTPPF